MLAAWSDGGTHLPLVRETKDFRFCDLADYEIVEQHPMIIHYAVSGCVAGRRHTFGKRHQMRRSLRGILDLNNYRLRSASCLREATHFHLVLRTLTFRDGPVRVCCQLHGLR